MNRVTVDQIMSWEPCTDYSREAIDKLFAGRGSLTADEIAVLDIVHIDRVWVILRMASLGTVTSWARWCAFQVSHKLISSNASLVKRYLETGSEELRVDAWAAAVAATNPSKVVCFMSDAFLAATAAVSAAVCDNTSDADWGTYWDEACNTACEAAWSAAWIPDLKKVNDDVMEAQLKKLVDLHEEAEKKND